MRTDRWRRRCCQGCEGTFWLSTIDADGRPHMTAVGAFWIDGRYDFTLDDAYAVMTKEPDGATRWTF